MGVYKSTAATPGHTIQGGGERWGTFSVGKGKKKKDHDESRETTQ